MTTAFLGLGSNLGDREATLEMAMQSLERTPNITVFRTSPLYETAPMYVSDQPNFINAAAEIRTSLGPLRLLEALLSIERNLGRERAQRFGPRTLDMDILAYGCLELSSPNLTIPHPRLIERAFVILPLRDIAPELVLPGIGRVSELAAATEQPGLPVRRVRDAFFSVSLR